MRLPRDILDRIDRIEKAIRDKLGESPTEAQIRHQIKMELCQERFSDMVRTWESEFEQMLDGDSVKEIVLATGELIQRIYREPLFCTNAWSPPKEGQILEPFDPEKHYTTVYYMAQVYTSIILNLRENEIHRINLEKRFSDGWEPTKIT